MDALNTCNCELCVLRTLVFNNVTNVEMQSMCASKMESHYKKGQVVVNEGDEIKDFFYLKEGLVKIYKRIHNDKDQILSIAKSFDFVGMLTVFSDTHYHYSIAALEDSTVCYVKLEFIKDLVRKNGQFALDLLDKMSRTSDDIIKVKLDISKKNLRGRIAYILIFFSEKIYSDPVFDLPISRKEIAELIDMTTENVIRILSEFRKDKMIRINGKTIEIINPEMLRKICEVG